jgi:HAD superfamily hydrolase (TIGR01509 family)
MSVARFDLVLFDLGGVLIELSGVGAMQELSGIVSEDDLWERWLSSPWVRAFERGECTAEEFAAGMVDEWGLTVTPEAFLAAFRAWPVGPMPGAEDLVADVAAMVPVGCLSNTNSLHTEDQFSRWGIFARFEPRFLSHELGVLKPDRELFERVAELAGIPPARILFLDDNLINVEGARAAGFAADHTRGVDSARAALVARGVLAPTPERS